MPHVGVDGGCGYGGHGRRLLTGDCRFTGRFVDDEASVFEDHTELAHIVDALKGLAPTTVRSSILLNSRVPNLSSTPSMAAPGHHREDSSAWTWSGSL